MKRTEKKLINHIKNYVRLLDKRVDKYTKDIQSQNPFNEQVDTDLKLLYGLLDITNHTKECLETLSKGYEKELTNGKD